MKTRWLVLGALGVVACSGSVMMNDDGGVDASSKDATSEVTFLGDASAFDAGDAASDASDANDDAANPDQPCATDDAGCVACCFNNHPDGSATYFDSLVNCACAKGATCHSASVCLNNLCKGYDPSPTCQTCLDNPDAGDCDNKAINDCSNDVDCVAFFDCLGNVCAPPPDDAGAD